MFLCAQFVSIIHCCPHMVQVCYIVGLPKQCAMEVGSTHDLLQFVGNGFDNVRLKQCVLVVMQY